MADLKHIIDSIEGKKEDYKRYDFSDAQAVALKAFFDLAQEFDESEDIYHLCVAIPKVFLDLEARLYLIDQRAMEFVMVSCTDMPNGIFDDSMPDYIQPQGKPYRLNGRVIMTIRGKKLLSEQLPQTHIDNCLGFLEVYPDTNINDHDIFFLEKYANRIGYNIHNRFLLNKNIEHLRFIQSLVADIEHNIIVPNMIFKLFLRRLKGKISKNKEIEKNLVTYATDDACDSICIEHLLEEMEDVNHGLLEEFSNIERHYQNTSLFLETLLRKSHFDKGHLTLRTKPCNMKQDVIQPQLEQFAQRFKEAGFKIEDIQCKSETADVITLIDVGLIAQVYANLFSNALKYAQEATAPNGEKIKLVRYCRDLKKDYFGTGKDGVKYSVLSSGPHIKPEERDKIFEEGYRGSNSSTRPGTGHGLTFIKNAVEIHGGIFGYEPHLLGNNFYFVLPK
ncbi:histidine kinase [Candidatus Magnetobacterium bavaricum]|uniref:histidine kinase n=1 Tax=Candidatus Magnetobacterium bavaricum TaxID=29290 RepID=A0A0F3GLJ2_9BACT|nr:histidine kinase [Candidatus Magnetobacterium bavaricum]